MRPLFSLDVWQFFSTIPVIFINYWTISLLPTKISIWNLVFFFRLKLVTLHIARAPRKILENNFENLGKMGNGYELIIVVYIKQQSETICHIGFIKCILFVLFLHYRPLRAINYKSHASTHAWHVQWETHLWLYKIGNLNTIEVAK